MKKMLLVTTIISAVFLTGCFDKKTEDTSNNNVEKLQFSFYDNRDTTAHPFSISDEALLPKSGTRTDEDGTVDLTYSYTSFGVADPLKNQFKICTVKKGADTDKTISLEFYEDKGDIKKQTITEPIDGGVNTLYIVSYSYDVYGNIEMIQFENKKNPDKEKRYIFKYIYEAADGGETLTKIKIAFKYGDYDLNGNFEGTVTGGIPINVEYNFTLFKLMMSGNSGVNPILTPLHPILTCWNEASPFTYLQYGSSLVTSTLTGALSEIDEVDIVAGTGLTGWKFTTTENKDESDQEIEILENVTFVTVLSQKT